MRNTLIVDAGGTKTDWILAESDGDRYSVTGNCRCSGINAMLADSVKIADIVAEAGRKLPGVVPDAIYYYGAGCATSASCKRIADALELQWPGVKTEVSSDMLGAARGMLGNGRGIACILGTGSNSCLYDGINIIDGIPSLGYILGDEGSGSALGKRLLNDVLKRQLPQYLCDDFKQEYNIEIAEVLSRVYHEPEANRYLAGFVPFLGKRLLDPYVYQLVVREFTRFVKRNVLPYPGSRSLPIAFTGSVSMHFEKILREAASQVGISIKTITASPLEGLVKYHAGKL